MQQTLSTTSKLKSYLTLTKPGIIMGNLVTAAAGFLMGSHTQIDGLKLLITLVGLAAIVGAGCVFNQMIDREKDSFMARTKRRPLVTGALSIRHAAALGSTLTLLGTYLLATYINWLSLSLALLGLLVYLLFYTIFKYKSVHGTLVGSIAGALPPAIGHTAASGQLESGSYLLFLLLVLWQMPHFYAIAIYRLNEYKAASLPVLPIKKGIFTTKVQILIYSCLLLFSLPLLPLFHCVHISYLWVAMPCCAAWVYLCYQGFTCPNDTKWARKVFLFSLLIINVLSLSVLFTRL